MDQEIKMMLDAIIEEIGRMEVRMNKRFDSVDVRFKKIEDRLEAMQHEINACKLERDSVGLLMRAMEQLENRVDALKIKTA